MGCICSKGSSNKDKADEYEKDKEYSNNKGSSVQLVPPSVTAAQLDEGGNNNNIDGSSRGPHLARSYSKVIGSSVRTLSSEDQSNHSVDVARKPSKNHHNHPHMRCVTTTLGGANNVVGERKHLMSRILSVPRIAGEHVDAGWPFWLSSVAGEAIKGWVPRRADTFEKLDQIGQGAYSSVHKARDLETGKIVALKKVRFSCSDPESVRFMAREIFILRQLDHPNVMKLEGIVTSRTSTTLYLVFEYMEHDLVGLATIPGIKLTEPQIKCYMQQLLLGLEHCHGRGVLHRDIKGSNLLADSNGNLKIADFGLATVYDPDKKQPLTSRVVTLWYRPPELLLGATEYGAAIDLWSAGCILAELLVGKPIMPGRTEVEQMHKIFKLCGSPSEDYWQKTKFPHATSFKPQVPYPRNVAETFQNFSPSALALVEKLLSIEPEDRGTATSALQSEFFTTEPLPCDPSSLPKFPPSKEFDAKRQNKEAMRKNTTVVQGRASVCVLRPAGNTKALRTPECNAQEEISIQGKAITQVNHKKYGGGAEPSSSLNKRVDSSRKNNTELRAQRSFVNQAAAAPDLSNSSANKEQGGSGKEPGMGYVPKKNRIHYSGPLVPPGGNIDDMLREHERLMQEAFRSVKTNYPKNRNYK